MKFRITESPRIPWNKGIKKIRPDWQQVVDDDGKLYQRYLNKKINASKEGVQCLLTFEEFCSLVKQAGLTSSKLGFSGGQKYVLARFNDEGDYTFSNCRFVTQQQNATERKVSDKSREASKRNAAMMNASKPVDIGDRVKRGMDNSPYYIKIRKEAEERKAQKDAMKNPSYKGERNSQFGTYWITNGSKNMKWSDTKGPVPDGFYRGRTKT